MNYYDLGAEFGAISEASMMCFFQQLQGSKLSMSGLAGALKNYPELKHNGESIGKLFNNYLNSEGCNFM